MAVTITFTTTFFYLCFIYFFFVNGNRLKHDDDLVKHWDSMSENREFDIWLQSKNRGTLKSNSPGPGTGSGSGKTKYSSQVNSHQKHVGNRNLNSKSKAVIRDGEIVTFNPGDEAPGFTLVTLTGEISYPSSLFTRANVMFHLYDPEAGFLDALWHSPEALVSPFTKLPNNTHVIFLSAVPPSDGLKTAVWMKTQFTQALKRMNNDERNGFFDQFHFGVHPVNALGNWLTTVFEEWMCVDHNCGYSQIAIQSPDIGVGTVVKRLDARYDWLPSPEVVFPNHTLHRMVDGGDGCLPTPEVKGVVAYINDGGCSYFTKIASMEKSGAIGVVVRASSAKSLVDMNCEGEECLQQLSIPASMIPAEPSFIGAKDKLFYYQTTASSNYHFAIDTEGKLAEAGWWLYPSFKFLVWEAQWLNYKSKLQNRLKQTDLEIPVFESRKMQGQAGVVVNVTLPSMSKMQEFGKVELDMSLSCPGTRDTTCGHWDHTFQLFICCQGTPPQFCELEIGRWISPFRRRVGRWLTDITPLLPLLNGTCSFTMKTVPWAMPWIPSLNLRFSQPSKQELQPSYVFPLDHPGATFDHNYNSHFPKWELNIPAGVKRVMLYAVITGHGSDNNGCGEFCISSHHYNFNGYIANLTFSQAGSPEGCADEVASGVIPNEHGTWLYGRGGWCDGRQVDAWTVDFTNHISKTSNTLQYYGLFNGTDPNPTENPGVIILWSYLVYYK